MIPSHLFLPNISFLFSSKIIAVHQNVANCQNTLIVRPRTEVKDPSSRCMNESDVYDRCGHDTRQVHPSCTICKRTAKSPRMG